MILENHFLVDHTEWNEVSVPTRALKTRAEPSEAGPRGRGGVTERYEVHDDEVKLIRAQGECLGIRSR